ncbi:MAG: DNA polymerase III subunit delta [Bacteroidetes bacterium]|nr:DNA polymerase III subunit delta [Bacteroidota bacterium]
MNFDQIIKNIKNKVYHPVYLLTGDEPYFIDFISGTIEKNILTEEEKEFNLSILYGLETDPVTVMNYAKRYPMMSNYQVIIVREAQNLDDIDQMVSYVENPLKSTILVICYKYKSVDKRKKFYKAIDRHGVVFESKPVYESQIPAWITGYLKEKGYPIQPQASALLADYLGNDLSRIVNEFEKLTLNIPARTAITPAHIEKFIGISKDFNTFELQKALAQRDIRKANSIINYLNANQKSNPLILTLANLFSFFSKVFTYHYLKDKSKNNVAAALKINPWFVQEYEMASRKYNTEKLKTVITDIREYDARLKGINRGAITDGELLRELVWKILH